MRQVRNHTSKVDHVGSDQEIFGLVNLDAIQAGRTSLYTPDTHLRLFQVMAHSLKDLRSQTLLTMAKHGFEMGQAFTLFSLAHLGWSDRRLVTNRLARTIPALLHFAGPKEPQQIWWDRMWWMQEEQPDETSLHGREQVFRPADRFMAHMSCHREEADGYGAHLRNGSFLAFYDVCHPFVSAILGKS